MDNHIFYIKQYIKDNLEIYVMSCHVFMRERTSSVIAGPNYLQNFQYLSVYVGINVWYHPLFSIK